MFIYHQVRFYLDVLWEAAKCWWNDNTFRLGAALAYYTVFSIAPIVLIAITIASLLFDRAAAQARIIDEISNTIGPEVGQAVGATLAYNAESGSGTLATVVSALFVVIGATGVFIQLQDALNTIWGVKPDPNRPWWGVVKDRVWSFGLVVAIGFLLLVSLIASTALSAVTKLMADTFMPRALILGQVINWIVSLAVITLLFALVYKVLPDVKIPWRDVWMGAFVTALFFNLGKYLISLYLGQASWISAYGAAGSLIVILLWVYYSSQILLFGAEFTQVYARRIGEPLRPAAHAVAVTEEARARQGFPRSSPSLR